MREPFHGVNNLTYIIIMLSSKCSFRFYLTGGSSRKSQIFNLLRYAHNDIQRINNERYSLLDIKKEFQSFEGGKVTVSKDEKTGIAYIALDHIEKKNGMSGKMMVDLNDIVRDLETWKTGKGVVLYGSGGTFCSGGYHDTIKRIAEPEGGLKMATIMHDSVLRLRHLPFVSVSMITGKAIGGGAELILATDFRLMTPSSEIRFVEAKMGVGTGWGGGTLLRRLVGQRTALDLLLTCRRISPDEALVLGLADEIVEENDEDDDNALLSRTCEWLGQRISSHHHSIVQTMKGIVVSNDFEKERYLFSQIFGGPSQNIALSKNIKHK